MRLTLNIRAEADMKRNLAWFLVLALVGSCSAERLITKTGTGAGGSGSGSTNSGSSNVGSNGRSGGTPGAGNSDLRGAFGLYGAAFEERSPKVVSAQRPITCDQRNPGQSSIANGVLQFTLFPGLVYDSGTEIDIGLGKGLYLSALSVAYLLDSPEGTRAVMSVGGRIGQVLPVAGYRGQFGYWPSVSSDTVTVEGNSLKVFSYGEGERVDTYQRLDETQNTFLLVSTALPYREIVYTYGQYGIERITSTNACDGSSVFAYTNGKLTSISYLDTTSKGPAMT